jgi:hypothetical protein
VPPGSLPDTGEVFGPRGNGYTYGWNAPNFHAVDRNLVSDQRYDTLNFMQQDGWFTWEILVPNGQYTVHLVAGDPCCTDSRYRIRVEELMAIRGEPDEGQHWLEAIVLVMVTDGRLTVSNGFTAQNNRVNFIEIYPGNVSITLPPPTATATLVPTLTRTPTVTKTLVPTRTPTITRTPTVTRTLVPTKTPTVTLTGTPTATTTTPTPTATETATPTATVIPSNSPPPTPTDTPQSTPTFVIGDTPVTGPTVENVPGATEDPGSAPQFEATP